MYEINTIFSEKRYAMIRYLVLENGMIFEGEGFGADVPATGELVFTTGMCGYMETLTDPSYYGQIVMQTFPLIGNYGAIEEDSEGACCLSGYVVREWCDAPSNFRCGGTIDDFLKARGIPGICGIDTRYVTTIIRESGVMNAMISNHVPVDMEGIKKYKITEAVENASCAKSVVYHPDTVRKRVTLIDYGAKHNIVRELLSRGCEVTVVPASITAEKILEGRPDGLMLSNGPGDPADNTECIAQIAKLCGKVPIFGICLGHQLLALANGGKAVKLHYGHRGVNQPVKETRGPRTYITTQNHGYAVVSDSVKSGYMSFINANDGTCEGMEYPELRAFSVQFHPEACAGPHDTAFLFDRFLAMMEG